VDAGDIGAGHTVTALYEIALKGGGGSLTEPLRYAQPPTADSAARGDEIAFLRLRYKQPDGDASRLRGMADPPRPGRQGLEGAPATVSASRRRRPASGNCCAGAGIPPLRSATTRC
jgi:hypothetical protein